MSPEAAQKLYSAQHAPTAVEMLAILPEIADLVHAQLCALSRSPRIEWCERLSTDLEGIRRHVMRLRERLVAEGEGHGQ